MIGRRSPAASAWSAMVALGLVFLCCAASAQTPLVNGARQTGSLGSSASADSWTFTANAGDGIYVRAGTTNFTPKLQLYSPGNVLVGEAAIGNGNTRDGYLTYQATNNGTFTVLISTAYANQSGTYALYLAQAPAPIVVSPGDEGGALTNGAANPGALTLGDLDVWNFTANAGDSLMLRVGAVDFTPWLRLYGPNGGLVGETNSGNGNTRDGFLTLQATNAGAYTVVVSASYAGQSGTYTLNLAQSPEPFVVSPGDEGGSLTNGAANPATLTLGDLDMWNFTANAGDSLMLRVGATDFTPWIRLYGPDGGLVGETNSGNGNTRVGFITLQATNTGGYTVVVSATYANQSGTYSLYLAQAPEPFVVSPGDEGGALTNGTANPGALTLGDLDLWNFSADAGDSLILRVGATNFTPWIRLYGPTGVLVGETNSGNGNTRDGVLAVRATNSGDYTVVLSAAYPEQSGTYGLNLAEAPGPITISPGDQGGPLVNGVPNSGRLNLGDLEVWSFIGTVGDSNVLRVAATDFTPWIQVYGPDGALVGETTSGNGNARAGSVGLSISSNGVYTVVLSATYAGQSGTYTLKESRVPPDLIVPDTQTIDELTPLNVSISAQDPDQPVKPLVFTLVSGPSGLNLTLGGATNATLAWNTTESDGPSTNLVTVSVTDAVNGKSFTRTNSFTVIVQEINTAPHLTVPSDQTIDELSPLSVSASATDSDIPANPLAFSLISSPQGMTINATNGAIAWTPTEAQGPSTNLIGVVVTDSNPWAANDQHLSVTGSFTVVVREVNVAPVLSVPANLVIDELTTLTVGATATDVDIPANTLTFSLVAAPTGMSINPASGAIAWTPTEAQGPSTNLIGVVATDYNPWAVNDQHLSVTGSFTVIVREVNTPPVLQPIANQSLHYGAPLTIQAVATDADLPPNILTYSLVQAPTNMSINASSGLISWTPDQTQVGTYSVVVRVSDNGSPSLSATNTFQVVVIGAGSHLAIQRLTSGLMQLSITGDTGYNYELDISPNLGVWDKLLEFPLTNSPTLYTDPDSVSNRFRFYRLRLLQ